jgi:hypothetical protein
MERKCLILVCDENIGTGVPRALALVGYDTQYFVNLSWAGKKDEEWLPLIGQNQWLLFSCNKKMLLVPSERECIIKNKVGVVFLTNGEEYPAKVLRLLLSKWHILELLWDTTEKPFARFLSPNGKLTTKYRNFQLPQGTLKQGKLIDMGEDTVI